uniref:Putative nuclear transcription factor n=1 Tax=Trypanosoma vivax (strain Y486) TaxID=1055687 RepID=G0TTQ3_TRYVY|nr:putative nuclear transcription factor [Trypanosoma vivax Y486]
MLMAEEETELAKDLSERLYSGSYECSVCFLPIHLRAKLWACDACYGIMHLECVRAWARAHAEEMEKQSHALRGPTESEEFPCPICRARALTSTVAEFRCFCGKVSEPAAVSHLIPGSCGQTCEKARKDSLCPHPCTLACHPGPCSHCRLTRIVTCFCGKESRSVGCSSGIHNFECKNICEKVLDCGKHQCTVVCHEGACSICTEISEVHCYCGRTKLQLRCGDDEPFSCGRPCAKMLDCGKHTCNLKCHEGPCQPCLRTPERQVFCPCRKSRLKHSERSQRTSCLDPIPSCGLKCEAPLPCGHPCAIECHDSPACPPCNMPIKTKCACGSQSFEMYCFCTYLPSDRWKAAADELGVSTVKMSCSYPPKCNRPCKTPLSCGKHNCREVCCMIKEHICCKICTKRLSCGTHNCGRLCHRGTCPPCSTVSYERLYCRCRRSWVEPPVPCGTPPPQCNHTCIVPRPCGHPANHSCHSDDQCPDCVVLVEKRCDSHGSVLPYFVPCHRKSVSCGRVCEKALRCCGTVCKKLCHAGECKHNCTGKYPALGK